ncbi:hypothetical protein ACIP79_05440 [Streptomyces sp. NPDC088747]|uniref:hypothetical protein n=1 Tax=Streptomyces sp. NPDC088747 TaxID=3365886 RepID=UPI0037F4E8E1
MAVDLEALERGIAKTNERLDGYRGFRREDNPGLRDSVDAVFERMRVEGREINAGVTPAEDQAVVDRMMERFNEQRAFEVRGKWRIDNQNKPEYASEDAWQKALGEAAATHVEHTGAWSKTTGMPAEVWAEANDGRTLEITTPGSAFDGIHYGNDRSTPFPTLNYAWGGQSKTFMGESRGMVHAQVLRGIDESSVLNKIEMPELLKKMEAHEVDGVTFHVRRRNQQTGVLDETDTFTVASRASWARVQMLQRTDSYAQEQGREYQTQQIGRAIYRNRDGMQHSLDNFKAILDAAHADPHSAVIMTSADTRFPDGMQVSPEQMQGWERRSSQSSDAGANWPAKETAEEALIRKLNFVESRSGTQSPASSVTGQQERPDLSRMDTLATVRSTGADSERNLAPVNTVASGGPLVERSESQYLPSEPHNQPAVPQFNRPQYDAEPLTRITSGLNLESPGDMRSTPSYFDPQAPSSSTAANVPSSSTGAFLRENPSAPRSDGSTSSSDGFGETLTRVNANLPQSQPQNQAAPVKKGRR